MIRGIRYQKRMDIDRLKEAGFGLLEYKYGQNGPELQPGQLPEGWQSGVVVSGSTVKDNYLKRALGEIADLRASYLVVETVGVDDGTDVIQLLDQYTRKIQESGIRVYIENGFGTVFSEVSALRETVDRLNSMAGEECFGICLNTGYANLLERNISGMIDGLGHRIRLLHANDNDGKSDQMQLPYTFTRGRGMLSTDWYSIIGALAMAGFKGQVVYDVSGLLNRSPMCLYSGWYHLLSSVAKEWEMILELEEYLMEAKNMGSLVLFGAGNMFTNYMDIFGEKYPPSYLVDNNQRVWGSQRKNVEIRSPETLREDKNHPPCVLICNMYYESIAKQLKCMGVRWHKYDDKYFFRYQKMEKG